MLMSTQRCTVIRKMIKKTKKVFLRKMIKKDKKSVFVKNCVFVGFEPIETLRFNLK